MIVINLFAGPGAGKSTLAARIFSEMKDRGKKIELVTEYAKDLTWENREDLLQDQLYILAKQNRRLARLTGKVDWVVTDSPILLGYQYTPPDYFIGTFKPFLLDLWNNYHNFNFLVTRVKPYQEFGRTQTEVEARQIDRDIEQMLITMGIPHDPVVGDRSGVIEVIERLTETYPSMMV